MSDPQSVAKAYHQRTKHQPQRFAAGPETLDWDAQPDPFRQWAGAPQTVLPLVADSVLTPWADLLVPDRVVPQAANLSSIGLLFELSFALTAWKQFGPDRWALRANPSSGNLHPTEVYLMATGVAGLPDGLHHYEPREHALAMRAELQRAEVLTGAAQLWVGLSSIQWREAWKYGERAFRYCQLDMGHALGALRYALAVLGWQMDVLTGVPHAQLAGLMGLDRDADFGPAEREEPELLIQIGPRLPTQATMPPSWAQTGATWHGHANVLDRHPMYRWPQIDRVSEATRLPADPALSVQQWQAMTGADQLTPLPATRPETGSVPTMPPPPSRGTEPACTLIRGRRSAQHFDRRASMPAEVFFRMLQRLMPASGLPWDAWPQTPRVHAVIYAHRVDGLRPGAYVLPRSEAAGPMLREALRPGLAWERVPGAPAGLPLHCLSEHPVLAGALRTLSCHQAIGSDACFAVSLLAEFEPVLDTGAWQYRALFQEAGLIGQALYLNAEAEGLRGTGIGCYFDDAVHELLGLTSARLQVLYQFTVGVPTVDTRISTEPPYAHRTPLVCERPPEAIP